MPLQPNAELLIRGNLSVIKKGKKPRPVVIGQLTAKQLNDINIFRASRGWEPILPNVVLIGSHVYESRVVRDGYSEEDLLRQIETAMSEKCRFIVTKKMTVLQHPEKQDSGYGCAVRMELTLECSTRFPMAELFSVVPRGDINHKPAKLREAAEAASLKEK